MYRIWEHPDTKDPDRPPVCIITCSWYPQIRLKALACPDVSVDEFICGLQLPDAVYRILTGNRPTNIYIGNECRILDGYGEHKAKPLRHVAIALRLVTEMGKCILLFPDQYLNLRDDTTLAELVCCETIAPTTRKVHTRLVDDRPLLDAEERQFLATQHPNSQWLWSSTLAPLLRQPPLAEKTARPLPPWKPPQKLEWIKYSTQQRRRRKHMELGDGPTADALVETSKTQEHVLTDEYREVGKCERTFERNALEPIEGRIVEVDTIAPPHDEPQTEKPSLNGNNETHNQENHPHKRARIESVANKPKVGEDIPNLDDASTDDGHSPLGKAVTELGSIIKSLTNASPGNIKSPLKQAISKLGGNIDMLKKTSNMDKGSQRDAISQLDDHIQHLKTLSDGIDDEASDLAGEGEATAFAKKLFRQHDAVSLSTTTNGMGPNEMISKNQAVPEDLPPLVSDAEPPKGQRGETTNGGKVPLLVLRQPALPEPELEKVWSDVDDDKNAAIPNDLGDTNSGDKSSASSSAATSSSSSSSSTSSSSSSDSDSDSVDSDHDAIAPPEEMIISSENVSNGNASESMEFEVPEQPLKDNDNDLSPENVDFDEEKLSPAPRALTVQPAEDPTAPTSEETAVASNSSSEGSSSDSSSDSDSDSSSDSGSSKTSHQSNLPAIGETSNSITAVTSENLRESAQAVRKVETGKDHHIPMQVGVDPIATLGNRRRRKPLLSSKKKIII